MKTTFRHSLIIIIDSFYTSELLADPLITRPELVETHEPWLGESNDFSELLHITVQLK